MQERHKLYTDTKVSFVTKMPMFCYNKLNYVQEPHILCTKVLLEF